MHPRLQRDPAARHSAEHFAHGFRSWAEFLLEDNLSLFVEHTIPARAIAQIQSNRQLLFGKIPALLCRYDEPSSLPVSFISCASSATITLERTASRRRPTFSFQFNSTICGLNDRYPGVFGGRRVLFLNPLDMEARNLRAGQIVDIYSHFEGEVRKAPRFAIVPYAIARRSAAAYYPETNVLIPVRSVAAKSNQPAAKSICITLTPADPDDALHFPKTDLDHNLDRAVPRVP